MYEYVQANGCHYIEGHNILCTMCRGEAQGKSDRRIIPAFSSLRNSAWVTRRHSGSRQRAWAKPGLLLVSMMRMTPCAGGELGS
jgi:hypothetical protein